MFQRYERVKNPKGNLFSDYKQVTYYDYHEVDKAIADLAEMNYECCQIDEGSLGSGTWVCVPPDDNHYYYVFWEVGLNEWQSGHRMRRCKKLTKEHQRWLDEYRERKTA